METRKNPTADPANEAIDARREALADDANFCAERCDNIARRIYQIRQVAYLTDCDDPLESLTVLCRRQPRRGRAWLVARAKRTGRNGGGLLGGAAGQPRPLGREKIPLHAGNDFKSRNGGMNQ